MTEKRIEVVVVPDRGDASGADRDTWCEAPLQLAAAAVGTSPPPGQPSGSITPIASNAIDPTATARAGTFLARTILAMTSSVPGVARR